MPVNVDEDGDLGDLKLLSAAPKRDSRIKEKKVEPIEKVENIKDVLKDLRGKLNSRDKGNNYVRDRGETIKTVITPDLFGSQRNRFWWC